MSSHTKTEPDLHPVKQRGYYTPSMPPGPKNSINNPLCRQRIAEAIRMGATYELAAAAGNISYPTLARWRTWGRVAEADDPEGRYAPYREFVAELEAAEWAAANAALSNIMTNIDENNWLAAAWLLERRWGYTRPVEAKQQTKTVNRIEIVYGEQTAGKSIQLEGEEPEGYIPPPPLIPQAQSHYIQAPTIVRVERETTVTESVDEDEDDGNS